ncbi:MAG: response regulator [Pyrinomonadaceae bacterium]|nr:response regulator [Pyrinomonadaceae bacterium]
MRKAGTVPQIKKHILCVDDNSDSCDLMTAILKEYEVTSTYSMADAIKRATAEKFDLYILDYHLPDGTGLELCLMLKTFDPDTPILFATATSSITEAQVITARAQGLVQKGRSSFVDDLPTRVVQLFKE